MRDPRSSSKLAGGQATQHANKHLIRQRNQRITRARRSRVGGRAMRTQAGAHGVACRAQLAGEEDSRARRAQLQLRRPHRALQQPQRKPAIDHAHCRAARAAPSLCHKVKHVRLGQRSAIAAESGRSLDQVLGKLGNVAASRRLLSRRHWDEIIFSTRLQNGGGAARRIERGGEKIWCRAFHRAIGAPAQASAELRRRLAGRLASNHFSLAVRLACRMATRFVVLYGSQSGTGT